MNRLVRWNDPLCLDAECVIYSVVTANSEDIIKLQKHLFPERKYTDDEALFEYMVVLWAWFVDEENSVNRSSS